MARKAIVNKQIKKKEKLLNDLAAGRKPKHPTKVYNRCGKCGRIGSYMRRFDLCRICFRELARAGDLMGIKKSSW
ncbi:type Z 30S ribosomal protein S14 [Candidatus Peregrinibacteria bacterium CG11_big_fil_rev_8_21_14_0_20_46_8]|nr:MAG: type Z 30S ribosomal protein S14 [Candidatus Peregrinibacteria bacterium CG11_big_fil_rev_8_21_14_0_20_46_8]